MSILNMAPLPHPQCYFQPSCKTHQNGDPRHVRPSGTPRHSFAETLQLRTHQAVLPFK